MKVPSDDEQRAQRLLREGVDLRRSGDELTALSRFEQADAAWPSPKAKAQIGLAEKSLKRYAPAEKHLKEALSATDDPWIVANRGLLEAALTFVAAHAAKSASQPQPQPAESTPSPPTPPAAAPPAPAPGVLAPKPPSTTADPRRVAAYATGSLALISAVAGGYFAVRAVELRNERDDVCPARACPTQRGVDLDQDARRAASLSTIGTVVAASSALTAAYLWLTREKPEERPQSQGASRFSIAAGGVPGGVLVQASWVR